VGLGAMGGGMARALLESEATGSVLGYDVNQPAHEAFFQEAKAARKVGRLQIPPNSLKDAILDRGIDVAILSLVNESQCDAVSFGAAGSGERSDDCLLHLMPKGSCVVLTSTVTGTSSPPTSSRHNSMHSAIVAHCKHSFSLVRFSHFSFSHLGEERGGKVHREGNLVRGLPRQRRSGEGEGRRFDVDGKR
jgi:NAD binding domain of 6-phosphogluconate dehydrogenase